MIHSFNDLDEKTALRFELLKAAGYDVANAAKYYAFVAGNEPKDRAAGTTEPADGVYLMYGKTAVPYIGQEVAETDKAGCTGIGVKFGGKSLVSALDEIGNNDRPLTTGQGGTRFITDYHKAVEDMDGMAATNDIRDILNMGIADDEYIPSLGELYFMLAHFTQINAALEAVGGEPLRDNVYWSSTGYSATYAWSLYLGRGGGAYPNTKATGQVRVRAVSAFLPLNS